MVPTVFPLLAALSVLASPASGDRGVVIRFQETGGAATFTSQGNRLRIETSGAARRVTLFDGDAKELVELDPAARTYRVSTQADARAMSVQLDAMLSNLPPQQRALVEAELRKQRAAPTPPTYEATGKSDSVAGFRCDGYRVLRDGKVREEGCFIPWAASPVTREDLKGLLAFARFMDEFAANMSGGRAGGNGLGDQFTRAPGFPALIQDVAGDGQRTDRERLVSVERASVAAEAFVVPSGYARVERSGPGGGAGGERPRP